MLIYNFQKEFLGIDEKDLHTLGYKDLAALRMEVTDFADLFVKTPGYIHNFQHVHWIDFIACAESNEESKVIINANAKSYRAVISISNAYLIDNPNQRAYLISLNNLRALTNNEYEHISADITQKPIPTLKQTFPQTITPEIPLVVDAYDEEPLEETHIPEMDKMLDVGDLSFDAEEPLETVTEEDTVVAVPEVPTQVIPSSEVQKAEKILSAYTYDPHIASKELGLPLDLIEEFIQDFIDQANDFKEGLYTALHNDDIDNVKILSHKLKGVAANLRIEDAYEVLSVINAATDADAIKINLDTFYKIIAKLSGKDINPKLEIKDADVPDKIDIPELIDDEFLNIDEPENAEEPLELNLDESEDVQEVLELKVDEDKNEDEDQNEDEDVTEPNVQEYSKRKIANEIGIDFTTFNELFKDFVEESHTLFDKINTALDDGNNDSLKIQVLKFKGMCDNMRMHTFADELEILMHSDDKESIREAINTIDSAITKILQLKD
jgi:HPt (histidine-containing phosphotransfer) domain-containing protein